MGILSLMITMKVGIWSVLKCVHQRWGIEYGFLIFGGVGWCYEKIFGVILFGFVLAFDYNDLCPVEILNCI